MERFYNVVIHPKEDDGPWNDSLGCPCPPEYGCPDCNSCKYLKYIGTFGGEYYIDCTYDEGTNI